MRKLLLPLAFGLFFSTGAQALEIIDSAFEVRRTVEGKQVTEATTTVPLSFDDTCWYWYLRFPEMTGEVTFTERLVLPAAPESWGDPNEVDPAEVEPFRTEEGGKVGVSVRKQELADGWLNHGWCFLPGDPTGPHYVEISVDGQVLKRFDFEVVPLGTEDKPKKTPQKRTDRSGRLVNKA